MTKQTAMFFFVGGCNHNLKINQHYITNVLNSLPVAGPAVNEQQNQNEGHSETDRYGNHELKLWGKNGRPWMTLCIGLDTLSFDIHVYLCIWTSWNLIISFYFILFRIHDSSILSSSFTYLFDEFFCKYHMKSLKNQTSISN